MQPPRFPALPLQQAWRGLSVGVCRDDIGLVLTRRLMVIWSLLGSLVWRCLHYLMSRQGQKVPQTRGSLTPHISLGFTSLSVGVGVLTEFKVPTLRLADFLELGRTDLGEELT